MLIMMEIIVYASDQVYIKALANIIINHNIVVMVVMMMVVVMVNGDEEMYPHLTVAINSATKCQF